METQSRMILEWLKDGLKLTPLDALHAFGCFRLSARIYDLKQAGWPIQCERVTLENEKVVAEYSMTTNRSEWPNEF